MKCPNSFFFSGGAWGSCYHIGVYKAILNEWGDEIYNLSRLIDIMQIMMTHNALQQLVSVPTRIEKVGDKIQRSIIDHCYSNDKDKIKDLTVEELGDSDHLCVKFTKPAKSTQIHQRPKKIRKGQEKAYRSTPHTPKHK